MFTPCHTLQGGWHAAFALATEPESQRTKAHQKVPKGLITLANALLVYFAVVGGSANLGE